MKIKTPATCRACDNKTVIRNGTGRNDKQLWRCTNDDCKSSRKPVELGDALSKVELKDEVINQFNDAANIKVKRAKYYMVTCALEASPVHTQLLENMEAYADYIMEETGKKVEILIVPQRYTVRKDTDIVGWAEEIQPYWVAGRKDIHKHVELVAEVKVLPTSANPLNSWEGLTGKKSTIIAHPRMHYKVLPGLAGHRKSLMTTGCITEPRYSDSRAGAGGEFHHTYGFLMLESNGDKFHARQVHASSNGAFQDLTRSVDNGTVYEGSYLGVVWGDLHDWTSDNKAVEAGLRLAERGKAPEIIIHDGYDMAHENHHNRKDLPHERSGLDYRDGVATEVQRYIESLRYFHERTGAAITKVRSNHDEALDRWIRDIDWRYQTQSPELYLRCALALTTGKITKGVLAYLLRDEQHINCLELGEAHYLGSYYTGEHGHNGAGGSRGTFSTFRKLAEKNITGHRHFPGRLDGAVSVGTNSILDPNYAKGKLSSWMHADAVVTENDKCQLVIKIGGVYTTFPWA